MTSLLDLDLSIHNSEMTTKFFDKRKDIDCDILTYVFVDWDIP